MRGQIETVHGHHLRMDVLDQTLKADGRNRQMMTLSVKITVLSCVSLLSSLLFVSFMATAIYLQFTVYMDFITNLWLQISTMISTLCLTLYIARTERAYDVLCCCCNILGYRYMKVLLFKGRDLDRSDSE